MIRNAVLTIIACLLLAACERESSRPIEPTRGTPALWAIESDNGEPVGWLFGTIHALPDGAVWRTAALDQVVAGAGMLVVEVRDLDPKRLAAEFDKMARDEPVPLLATRLDPDTRVDLARLLDREAAPRGFVRGLDKLETWAAALAVAQVGGEMSPRNGADKALLAWFGGRPVRELEGAADQFAIFDALAERDQRAMLGAVVRERKRADTDSGALARAWLAGDMARVERQARTGLLADPALYEVLLAARNRNWIDALLPLLADGQRPLIAVGTAHMLGDDGLPALLAQQGYQVRRIQ